MISWNLPNWYSKRLPLSIECIDLIILRVEEAFYREILWTTVDVYLHVVDHFSGWNSPEELMVLLILVVEQIYKNEVVLHKCTGYERIVKVVNGHSVVVKSQSFVYI
jgi:hypothetical protein